MIKNRGKSATIPFQFYSVLAVSALLATGSVFGEGPPRPENRIMTGTDVWLGDPDKIDKEILDNLERTAKADLTENWSIGYICSSFSSSNYKLIVTTYSEVGGTVSKYSKEPVSSVDVGLSRVSKADQTKITDSSSKKNQISIPVELQILMQSQDYVQTAAAFVSGLTPPTAKKALYFQLTAVQEGKDCQAISSITSVPTANKEKIAK